MTEWCESSSHGTTGPSFFDKAERRAVTLNAERYSHAGNIFAKWHYVIACCDPTRYSVGIIVAAHTAQISMKVSSMVFSGRLISRFGDMTWPARSTNFAVSGVASKVR